MTSSDGRKRTVRNMASWAQPRRKDLTKSLDGQKRRRARSSNPKRNVPDRVELDHGGSMPVAGTSPKPPPIRVMYTDLAPQVGLAFDTSDEPRTLGVPVYGQYPRGLIGAMLPWLRCDRSEVLHVCSGALPRGEGIRVDVRPEAQPDIVADGRRLPFADGSIAGVMIDPPYTAHYARELYKIDYPRPSHLLREAVRVVRPGGRIVFVHYITPKPPAGARFVAALGLSTGFDMPIRAVSIYERDQVGLDLGVRGLVAVPLDAVEVLP